MEARNLRPGAMVAKMKVKDKTFKVMVAVYEASCQQKTCYWPRKNPGVFAQGRGYSGATNEWLCGTRHIRGCPPAGVKQGAAGRG